MESQKVETRKNFMKRNKLKKHTYISIIRGPTEEKRRFRSQSPQEENPRHYQCKTSQADGWLN